VILDKSKSYKTENRKIPMKKLILFIIFLISISLVNASIRENLEEEVQNMTAPQNIDMVLPFNILILVEDTGERFTLQVAEQNISAIDAIESDIIVSGKEEALSEINNTEDTLQFLTNVDVRPDSLKGSLALIAIEKKMNINIVKDPSLFYRILRFIMGIFIRSG